MNDSLAVLINSIPYYVGVGFGLGLVTWFVCWGIGKCWSLIHIAD